ncbi:MAG: IS982 family transposase [Nitrososphaeraceae archaeon]
MHNLEANFDKFLSMIKDCFAGQIREDGNFKAYPRLPKLSDCEVIALAIVAEALSVDSENLLFSKLRTDYPGFFARMPDRTNYNRRKRGLKDKIDSFSLSALSRLIPKESDYLIDSIPVPVCRLARASRLKNLKGDPDLMPAIGYAPIDRQYYFGFKLHMLSAESGVISNFLLTPANVHDISALKDLAGESIQNCSLFGDKGYISRTGQIELFEKNGVQLKTPNKRNQEPSAIWTPLERKKRKRIETLFSQFCDQLMLKRNYAKSFDGFFTRLLAKIAAFTGLQLWNSISGRPLNHVKHALAV